MFNRISIIFITVLVAMHWKNIIADQSKWVSRDKSETKSVLRNHGIDVRLNNNGIQIYFYSHTKPGIEPGKNVSLKMIPERATVTYVNEKYVYKNATVKVRRYARRGDYYVNIEGTIKMEFGNNVSLEVIFFEFLHNEYKRSFVEMKFNKICDTIDQDPYVGKAFKLVGLKCPILAGSYRLMNISIPVQDFPNVWPYERCKAEVTVKQNKNGDVK